MNSVERWVDEMAAVLRPDRVHWCDGSEAENERLIEGMLVDGTLASPEEVIVPEWLR